MIRGTPSCCLVAHHRVVHLGLLDLVSFVSHELCQEWPQLALPGVTDSMKRSGLHLAKRQSDEIGYILCIYF